MKRIIGIPFSKKKSSTDKDAPQQPGSVAPPPSAAPTSSSSGGSGPDPVQATAVDQQPQVVGEKLEKPAEDAVPPPHPPHTKEPGWLSRIGFRKNKVQPLGELLPELVNQTDVKVEELEKKIAQCEAELKPISIKLKKVSEGSTKNNLKAKAQAIIQRKKRYEEQAEGLRQQSFNIDQTSGTLQSTKDAVAVVAAMKQGVKELKKEQKKLPLDSLEDLHDEMGELFENSTDIQDVLGGGITGPQMIDDKELEEQLELLGDEIAADKDTTFLDEAAKNGLMSAAVPNINATTLHPSPVVDVGADLSHPPASASQDLNDIVFDISNSKV